MKEKGGFTLPGEAGYEKLTLALADKWGADCIRDSDGTQLSPEILQSGVPVYSTLCLVRSVHAWARQNMDKLQRNFLCTAPALAEGDTLTIRPLDGFFKQQFILGPADDMRAYGEVYDRTTGRRHDDWTYDEAAQTVMAPSPTICTQSPSSLRASGRRSPCTTTSPTTGASASTLWP